jgi:RNA polymerase-interacting CarD/CdnL/TRCF family regulator
MSDYQVGDKVIHARYGLGEIIKMDEKFIHGRQMLCYVVKVEKLTIWVMADEPGKSGLRLPTSDHDFENLFVILSSPGELLPTDRFDRKNELFERMKVGDLVSICTVIRDLNAFRHIKQLNDYDKEVMERAEHFLLEEWMYSRSVSLKQAYGKLKQLLNVVSPKGEYTGKSL